jgi:hypothetical protein
LALGGYLVFFRRLTASSNWKAKVIPLAWSTNVNEIITYASRAFALYYTLQYGVAWIFAWQN